MKDNEHQHEVELSEAELDINQEVRQELEQSTEVESTAEPSGQAQVEPREARPGRLSRSMLATGSQNWTRLRAQAEAESAQIDAQIEHLLREKKRRERMAFEAKVKAEALEVAVRYMQDHGVL